jgi:rsbT co-antagonist protein RsbR
MKDAPSRIAELLKAHQTTLLSEWVNEQVAAGALRRNVVTENQLREQSRRFLNELTHAAQRAPVDELSGEPWHEVREVLGELSRERAQAGLTPGETATFVFSLKQPLFALLRRELKGNAESIGEETWRATKLLDTLAIHTMEVYQQSRDAVIGRQQLELLELSTPVVELWENILALPLVGTLDSARTQVVMESLLQKIVDSGASIAIIDITGVPTVDTLVAQHLLKTVAATRLMGADCIISGIRPQIAQTIVHLGVDLGEVTTKATLADAFRVALQRTGSTIGQALASDERRTM